MTLQEAIDDLEYHYLRGLSPTRKAKALAIEALQFQQNVVRCGDCKHKVDREFSRVVCMRHTIETHKDGFCHNGKRRDEE